MTLSHGQKIREFNCAEWTSLKKADTPLARSSDRSIRAVGTAPGLVVTGGSPLRGWFSFKNRVQFASKRPSRVV
jgi:hypothetical protein